MTTMTNNTNQTIEPSQTSTIAYVIKNIHSGEYRCLNAFGVKESYSRKLMNAHFHEVQSEAEMVVDKLNDICKRIEFKAVPVSLTESE